MTTVRDITIETEQGSFHISTSPAESGYPGVDVDFHVKHVKDEVISMPRVLFELGESRLELIIHIWDNPEEEDVTRNIVIPLKYWTGIDPIKGDENHKEEQIKITEARSLMEKTKAIAPMLNRQELSDISEVLIRAIERIEKEG